MGTKSDKPSLNIKSVIEFFESQKEFKQIQTQFGELKTQFYSNMEDYFSHNNIDVNLTVDGGYAGDLVVTRIQNSKVEFNPDKLI